jgi:hypothetical protein
MGERQVAADRHRGHIPIDDAPGIFIVLDEVQHSEHDDRDGPLEVERPARLVEDGHRIAEVGLEVVRRASMATGQLIAATDEVRRLGRVAGKLDGPVVRRP